MNRALRRQQTREAKGQARAAPVRALPRTAAPRPHARREGRARFLRTPRFASDIISELRKVVWPTRDEIVHLTTVVVIITIVLGALLGSVDIGFGWLIDHTILR